MGMAVSGNARPSLNYRTHLVLAPVLLLEPCLLGQRVLVVRVLLNLVHQLHHGIGGRATSHCRAKLQECGRIVPLQRRLLKGLDTSDVR